MDKLRNSLRIGRNNVDNASLNTSLLGGDYSHEDQQDEAVAEVHHSANDVALSSQQRNNDEFQENLRREEEQIYSDIRTRKLLEQEDQKIALQMHRELGNSVRVEVQVPRNAIGGHLIRVILPNRSRHEIVQIPPGLKPGESFMYISGQSGGVEYYAEPESVENYNDMGAFGGEISEEVLQELPEDIRQEIMMQQQMYHQQQQQQHQMQQQQQQQYEPEGDMLQIEIPQGLSPGQQFQAMFPDGKTMTIEVPPGFGPGDVIGIPRSEVTQQAVPAPAPPPPRHPPPTHDEAVDLLSSYSSTNDQHQQQEENVLLDFSTSSGPSTGNNDSNNNDDGDEEDEMIEVENNKPPLERLKEAKAQLDRGEITQEEFNEIKRQVIAAI